MRIVTFFNCLGKKFFVLTCKAKGLGPPWQRVFLSCVFFRGSGETRLRDFIEFKLINPLIEDVDSAALERLK